MRHQHLGQKRTAIAQPHLKNEPLIQVPCNSTLQLQGAIGNRAVNRTIAAQQNSDSKTLQFRGLSQELAGEGILTAPIQAKLVIGQPGDRYEREADRIAHQVVDQLHAPQSATTGETVQRQDEEDTLQMKPLLQSPSGGIAATSELEAEIGRSRRGGQPLAESIREPMEQAFGFDFSGVRVHADAQADRLNRAVQARAFTTRQDLFFRQGTYNPGSREGQELIAHELTHAVQQGRALQRKEQIQQLQISTLGNEFIQRDHYAYGGPSVTPHIHVYGTDSHVKISTRGKIVRYNLVQGGRRVAQARLNEAFDAVRESYPHDIAVAVTQTMRTLLRGAPRDDRD